MATEHEDHETLMRKVQTAIDLLVSGDDILDDSARGALLGVLRADLTKFGNEVLEHLDHEEHSFATPVARKVGVVCKCVTAGTRSFGQLPLCSTIAVLIYIAEFFWLR